MTLRVYVCFIEFYVFVFYEIDVGDPKILYQHTLIGNIWVRIHVGPTRVPKVGPKLGAQNEKAVPID